MNTASHAMRDAFGQGLLEAARQNDRIVALSADVYESTRMHWLREAYPDRYFEMGISEQHMIGAAAGLALEGFIPFAATYACFSPGRAWEQMRSSICYQNANVKIIGAHIGFGPGRDGATHQCFEDIAITRCLPNLTVISPADSNECFAATQAIANHTGPVYMRMSRNPEPVVTASGKPFTIGRMDEMRQGSDITFIATGRMVLIALQIADALSASHGLKIRVLNAHTIKPMDVTSILKATQETQAIITFEEHQAMGGMGSAVAEIVCQAASMGGRSVPMKIHGMKDRFGHSGESKDLYNLYDLDQVSLQEQTMLFLRAIKVL